MNSYSNLNTIIYCIPLVLSLITIFSNGCTSIIKDSHQLVEFSGNESISLSYDNNLTIPTSNQEILNTYTTIFLNQGKKEVLLKKTRSLNAYIKCSTDQPSKKITIPNYFDNYFIFGNFFIYFIVYLPLLFPTPIIFQSVMLTPWAHIIDLFSGKAYQYKSSINLDNYCH